MSTESLGMMVMHTVMQDRRIHGLSGVPKCLEDPEFAGEVLGNNFAGLQKLSDESNHQTLMDEGASVMSGAMDVLQRTATTGGASSSSSGGVAVRPAAVVGARVPPVIEELETPSPKSLSDVTIIPSSFYPEAGEPAESPAPSKAGKGSVASGEARPRPSGHGAGATAPSVTLGAAPVPHTVVDVVTDTSGQNGRPQLHAAQRALPEPKASTFPPAPWHGGMVVGVNVNGTSARLGTRVSANGSAEVLGHEVRLRLQ